MSKVLPALHTTFEIFVYYLKTFEKFIFNKLLYFIIFDKYKIKKFQKMKSNYNLRLKNLNKNTSK